MQMDLTQITLGLDIATAVSVIGTGLWLVFNIKKQNSKKIGEERELERVQNLLSCQKKITSFNSQLISDNRNNNNLAYEKNLQDLHQYLLNEARPCLLLLCSKEDIVTLESAMKAIETYAQRSADFTSVDVIKKIAALELSLMLQIRVFMNNEEREVSEKIVKDYSISNYGFDLLK